MNEAYIGSGVARILRQRSDVVLPRSTPHSSRSASVILSAEGCKA